MPIPEALAIYRAALGAVKSDVLIRQSIRVTRNKLTIENWVNKKPYDKYLSIDLGNRSLHIIGGGKSVLPMACALLQQIKSNANLEPHNVNGCLSLPVEIKPYLDRQFGGASELLHQFNVRCHYGAKNNLPDRDSVLATGQIIGLVDEASSKSKLNGTDGIYLVLLSGGGSACLSMPKLVELEEKLSIINALVSRGADIIQLNTVRRCLSQVKGGRLARYILDRSTNSKVVTLMISDVVGDPIEFIGSGPTYLGRESSETSARVALDIIDKYSVHIKDDLRHLLVSDRNGDKSLDCSCLPMRVHNFIIGNNSLALDAAINKAQSLGYYVEYLGNELHGNVEHILDSFLERARGTMDGTRDRICIIGGGEATIELKQPVGIGGRAQEMALRYLNRTKTDASRSSRLDYDDVFLAAGTDGQDGPTRFAGCLASLSQWDLNGAVDVEMRDSLKRHDSNGFWSRHKRDWLIETGLTGTNVMDLYLLLLDRNNMEPN